MALSAILLSGADTVKITGSDSRGLITFTSKASYMVNSCSVRVNFNYSQLGPVPVILQPIGYQTGLNNPNTLDWFVGDTKTATGFSVICAPSMGGIAPATTFIFYYYCPGAAQ
jgi:hypothetical protein